MLKSIKSAASENGIIVLIFLLIGNFVVAQNFKLLRYDEDYQFLKDSAQGFYNKLKFNTLNKKQEMYISLGGEARYEYVDFNNEDWGRFNIGHNNFLLQRYDLHADLHLGKIFRLFAQLRSALQDGRINGPRNTDEDQLNIQNLFLDITIKNKYSNKLIARLGRQELNYGSGRLISVREGPNARLYFTGGKLLYYSAHFSIDGFALMADTIYGGLFDNKISRQLNLWGAYSKFKLLKKGNIDLYYLGFRKDQSLFEEGISPERRHTIGTRFWKLGSDLIFNVETAYQFGTFGANNIRAWTFSIDVGYCFNVIRFKPTLNLRNDYISGDKKQDDGILQTFNPLYPKGGYFGLSPQTGPVNLIDIHPYVTLDFLSNLKMQADVVLNWRYSLQDGIYRPSGMLNIRSNSSNKRYIGTSYLVNFTYDPNKHISVISGIQYFKTGAFIDDVVSNSKDGIFFNARLGFKF